MDIYQLEYVLHEPQESEGCMHLAEIPALQGAMAWVRRHRRRPYTASSQWRRPSFNSAGKRGRHCPREITPLRSHEGTLTVAA